MRISLCEQEHLYLIAEKPTGVEYEAQVGGIMCSHPSVEGAVIAVAVDHKEAVGGFMCEVGCYGESGWTTERIEKANEMLGGLGWDVFTEIVDLRLDTDRLSESTEGWWRVQFTVRSEYTYPKVVPVECVGVVCGPNCD